MPDALAYSFKVALVRVDDIADHETVAAVEAVVPEIHLAVGQAELLELRVEEDLAGSEAIVSSNDPVGRREVVAQVDADGQATASCLKRFLRFLERKDDRIAQVRLM